MISFFRKKIFLNSLEKIIENENYSSFISFFKDSNFEKFVSENKIDLTINNNFFVKKIISEKKFSLLSFFWYNDKVNLKLKNENPEMYQYCSLYYHIDEAISKNNIDNLKKLLENSFEKTLMNEYKDYFLLHSITEGRKEVITILLEDGRFDINFFDCYTIRGSILNNHKNIFLLLLNNEKIYFNSGIINLIFSYFNHIKPEDYHFFFFHLIKNKMVKKEISASYGLKEKYEKILNYYLQNKIDIF